MSALSRTAVCLACLCAGGLFVLGLAGGQDVPGSGKKEKKEKREKAGKKDPEEKAVAKSAEKATKVVETERDKWLKDLGKAFPDRFSPGLTDADFDQWFALLAGGGAEWVREDTPKKIRDLFDRAAGSRPCPVPAAPRRGRTGRGSFWACPRAPTPPRRRRGARTTGRSRRPSGRG